MKFGGCSCYKIRGIRARPCSFHSALIFLRERAHAIFINAQLVIECNGVWGRAPVTKEFFQNTPLIRRYLVKLSCIFMCKISALINNVHFTCLHGSTSYFG